MFETKEETSPDLPENLRKYAIAIQRQYATSKDSSLLAASNMLNGDDEDEVRFCELFDALKDSWGADRNNAVVAASIMTFLPTDKGVITLAESMHTEYGGQYTKGGCLVVAAQLFREQAIRTEIAELVQAGPREIPPAGVVPAGSVFPTPATIPARAVAPTPAAAPPPEAPAHAPLRDG